MGSRYEYPIHKKFDEGSNILIHGEQIGEQFTVQIKSEISDESPVQIVIYEQGEWELQTNGPLSVNEVSGVCDHSKGPFQLQLTHQNDHFIVRLNGQKLHELGMTNELEKLKTVKIEGDVRNCQLLENEDTDDKKPHEIEVQLPNVQIRGEERRFEDDLRASSASSVKSFKLPFMKSKGGYNVEKASTASLKTPIGNISAHVDAKVPDPHLDVDAKLPKGHVDVDIKTPKVDLDLDVDKKKKEKKEDKEKKDKGGFKFGLPDFGFKAGGDAHVDAKVPEPHLDVDAKLPKGHVDVDIKAPKVDLDLDVDKKEKGKGGFKFGVPEIDLKAGGEAHFMVPVPHVNIDSELPKGDMRLEAPKVQVVSRLPKIPSEFANVHTESAGAESYPPLLKSAGAVGGDLKGSGSSLSLHSDISNDGAKAKKDVNIGPIHFNLPKFGFGKKKPKGGEITSNFETGADLGLEMGITGKSSAKLFAFRPGHKERKRSDSSDARFPGTSSIVGHNISDCKLSLKQPLTPGNVLLVSGVSSLPTKFAKFSLQSGDEDHCCGDELEVVLSFSPSFVLSVRVLFNGSLKESVTLDSGHSLRLEEDIIQVAILLLHDQLTVTPLNCESVVCQHAFTLDGLWSFSWHGFQDAPEIRMKDHLILPAVFPLFAPFTISHSIRLGLTPNEHQGLLHLHLQRESNFPSDSPIVTFTLDNSAMTFTAQPGDVVTSIADVNNIQSISLVEQDQYIRVCLNDREVMNYGAGAFQCALSKVRFFVLDGDAAVNEVTFPRESMPIVKKLQQEFLVGNIIQVQGQLVHNSNTGLFVEIQKRSSRSSSSSQLPRIHLKPKQYEDELYIEVEREDAPNAICCDGLLQKHPFRMDIVRQIDNIHVDVWNLANMDRPELSQSVDCDVTLDDNYAMKVQLNGEAWIGNVDYSKQLAVPYLNKIPGGFKQTKTVYLDFELNNVNSPKFQLKFQSSKESHHSQQTFFCELQTKKHIRIGYSLNGKERILQDKNVSFHLKALKALRLTVCHDGAQFMFLINEDALLTVESDVDLNSLSHILVDGEISLKSITFSNEAFSQSKLLHICGGRTCDIL